MPTDPYPLIIRAMLQFKADLLAGEAAQIEAMGARWLAIEATLQDSFEVLAQHLETAADGPLTHAKLLRMERYRRLLDQVQAQLDGYADFAVVQVSRGQLAHLRLGLQHAVESIRDYFQTYGKVAGAFDLLPVSAIEAIVGFASDGSPLRSLFAAAWPESVEGLTQALIDGVALGRNPIETARQMRAKFGTGFHRAINIARTEQLRAYRASNIGQYQHSKLVDGYMRLSARDNRVCAACLMADDGTVYPLTTPFEEHPQGRCSPVPVVKGLPIVRWQSGQSWFLAQDPATQRSILGPQRYDAWLNQEFELADVVKRVENETWGASLVPTPLHELVK